MAGDRPMDRLICGDVGFGKTEVAIRAAFKAVSDGKQVALLVPTTVLAQQHFDTFNKRLTPYSLRTGLLSRFRTRAEQAQTLGHRMNIPLQRLARNLWFQNTAVLQHRQAGPSR